MNAYSPVLSISRLSFRQAVWLFPVAFTLHVLEELPRFTTWARAHASPLFTQSDYLKIHIAGIAVALIAAAVVWRFPNRIVVFVFLTFIFTPSVFYNTVFHAGATIYFGEYCPGVVTAVVIYVPLFGFVCSRVFAGGWISGRAGLISFVMAGMFHVAEVGHNVFKAW